MSNIIKTRFFVGDEWLYFKIYCGYKTSDNILIEIIKPFSEQLIKEDYIDKWFFIRYADPNHHIRFRLRLNDRKNIGLLIHNFNNLIKHYIESKSIWSIQIDCYDREIERYGLETIELSEEIFFNDSTEIVNYLSIVQNTSYNSSLLSKPIFSLKLIDFYLSTFELSDSQKLKFLEKLRESFYKEFDINKDNKKQIEEVYKNNKEEVYNKMMNTDNYLENKSLKKNLSKLLDILKKESSTHEELNYKLSSFIHMSINRLYYSNNRIHELVCYDVLWKFYKSKTSRN